MLSSGKGLLGNDLHQRAPAFHDYVLKATLTACLALRSADPVCRDAVAALDQLRGYDPVRDLLLAHATAHPVRPGTEFVTVRPAP